MNHSDDLEMELDENYYKELLRTLGYETNWIPTFPPEPSAAAKKLYNLFLERGYTPTLEYQVDRCWIDLAFPKTFSPAKIAVEVDGFAGHFKPKQLAYDQRKDYFLRTRGWEVIRIPAETIYKSPQRVIEDLLQEIYSIQLLMKYNSKSN